MPRIKTISSKEEVGPEQHAEIDAIVATLQRVTPPFNLMLHSPGLAQKLMEAGAHVRLNSTLTPKERQLVIAALAREFDCDGEWGAHLNNARNAGISDETLETIKNFGDASTLPEDEFAIVAYVQQMMRQHRVDQDLFDYLLREHDERWLIELTATLGQYLYVACILNAFEVETDVPESDLLPPRGSAG
jgi:4-carboxymuconolactone decarboxylase